MLGVEKLPSDSQRPVTSQVPNGTASFETGGRLKVQCIRSNGGCIPLASCMYPGTMPAAYDFVEVRRLEWLTRDEVEDDFHPR